jgi:hypothetical protein
MATPRTPVVKLAGGTKVKTSAKANPGMRHAGTYANATPHMPAAGGHGPQPR